MNSKKTKKTTVNDDGLTQGTIVKPDEKCIKCTDKVSPS